MGRLLRTGPVVAICSGGDGRRPSVAVIAGRTPTEVAGNRLLVWDVVSGEVVKVPVAEARSVAMGFATADPVVLTGHADGAVRVWALPDLALRREWRVGGGGVGDLLVVGPADDAIAVTVDEDRTVTRWSLASGESLGRLAGPPAYAICAGQLTGGRHVVVTGGQGLSMWNAGEGNRLPLPVPRQDSLGDIAAVLLSVLDGRDVLTVVTGSRELVTFDVATGAPVGERIDAHVDDFSEYRGRVWGGKHGRPKPAIVDGVLAVPTRWRVHLWEPSTSVTARPPLAGPVRKPVLATARWEGRAWLLTGSAEDGMVGLWDLHGPVSLPWGHTEQISHVTVVEPGVVVSVDEGGSMAARRIDDGSPVAKPTDSGVHGIAATVAWADGPSVRVATGAGSARSSHPWLQRWDLTSRAEISPPVRVGVPQLRHMGIALVRGERVLVVIDRDVLQLRRAADGSFLEEVRKQRGTFRMVVGSSAHGPIAVVSAIDRPPEVFRLEELAAPPSAVPALHGAFVAAMDGRHLVAGSLAERKDGWRTAWACDLSGTPLGPDVAGPPITSVAISGWPATYIARADGTVSLTDLETGRDLCPVLQLPAAARSIAVADDGGLLVGLGADVARFEPPA